MSEDSKQVGLDEALREEKSEKEQDVSPMRIRQIGIDVPEEWRNVSLGEIGELDTSGVNKKTSSDEKAIQLVNYMDVYENYEIDDSIKYMEVTAPKSQIERSQVRPGDILFTPSSEEPGDIGKSSVVTEYIEDTLHSYHTVRLRPTSDEIQLDISFSGWLANAPYISKQFARRATGSTRYTLTLGDFSDSHVLIPPIEEQRKIATVLYTVDQAIQKTEAISQHLSIIRRGLRQDIFSGQPGDETTKRVRTGPISIEIPQNWEIRELGDFVKKFTGGATLSKNEFSESGVSVIPKKAVSENGIATVDKEERQFTTKEISDGNHTNIIDSGHLVTALRDLNADAPSIGRIVKIDRSSGYPSGERFLLAQGVHGLNTSSKICDDYLIEISNSDWYRRYMKSVSVGSTQIHIRNDEFLGIEIPVPPLEEQEEIATQLRDIVRLQSDENSYRNQLQRLKQGLMQDLLSGTVRTHETDIEIPEAVLAQG
jgi:type I restriction enzyme S subunit